ncbi:uncharacterized protein LOC135209022 isoform X2 [Macrobrachium nipponense]|uniref:uncharacterized protein LOC135209022 isoform X2 n=1 Tax=Macrobrachium nipponense TaxID=159736 RepID=UPI0030C8A97B
MVEGLYDSDLNINRRSFVGCAQWSFVHCNYGATLRTSRLKVTWLKKDEDTILTAGGQVYSSETRYSVAHVRHQRIWELSIREVKLTDAGLYECQIATHPFTSYFFNLKVVEARAVIFGGPEIHIHTGNQLRLQCSVQNATEPPVYIFWFHNNSMVNYEAKRPLEVIVSHHYSSTLVISNVTWCDAGSYRCEPHNAVPSNVTVHVVEGEKQAALYKGQKESGSSESGTASSSSASITITCRVAVVMQLLITAYGSYWIRILHSLQGAASDNEASVL